LGAEETSAGNMIGLLSGSHESRARAVHNSQTPSQPSKSAEFNTDNTIQASFVDEFVHHRHKSRRDLCSVYAPILSERLGQNQMGWP